LWRDTRTRKRSLIWNTVCTRVRISCPTFTALLGQVYARTGRPKEAIKELTQGLASDEDGSVHYQLARLYQEAGDASAAAAAFEKSKQIRARHDALAELKFDPVR